MGKAFFFLFSICLFTAKLSSLLSVRSVNNSHLSLAPAAGPGAAAAREMQLKIFSAHGRLSTGAVSRKQVKELEPSLHCLRAHGAAGREVDVRFVPPGELVSDLVRTTGRALSF